MIFYLLQIGISITQNGCQVSNLSSERVLTNQRGAANDQIDSITLRTAGLPEVNRLSSAIENNSGSAGLKVDYCNEDVSSELNGWFSNMDLQGMLKRKDYQALNLVCLFFAGFNDHATGLTEEGQMTKVHTMHSDLIQCVTECMSDVESLRTCLGEMAESIRNLKKVKKYTFHRRCENRLYALNFHFHLLHHLVERLRRLETQMHRCLRDIMKIKRAYRNTSKLQASGMWKP